jgi:type IV fimbrial biogenesis protein FimT
MTRARIAHANTISMEGDAMHQKGLSLIELLAGLAIAATLLQFVGPHFKALIESVRQENAAQMLASGLRNARTEAILRNQTIVIHAVDDNWAQGWRIILDISGKGHEDADNPVLLERQESGQVTIVGNGPVKTYVRFTGLGEAAAFVPGPCMSVPRTRASVTIKWCWPKVVASACATTRSSRNCV